jgi:hypothetical protein
MVEFWKQARHLVARGHVRRDLLAEGVIVNMTVRINDLHQ